MSDADLFAEPRSRTHGPDQTETTRRQLLAGRPDLSAWVSANAGSGKTYVLARRVVRLLLAGVDPGKILCLTFTKAAAAEMQSRVYDLLAKWVLLDDADLTDALSSIEGRAPSMDQLSSARTLFARALETPGGLKIQTIHGFCESVLQRFPLEADVPASFQVLDEATAQDLLRKAQIQALRAAQDAGSPLGRAFAELIAHCGDKVRDEAIAELIGRRGELEAFVRSCGGPDTLTPDTFAPDTLAPVTLVTALSDAMGIDPSITEAEFVGSVPFAGLFSRTYARTLADGFRHGKATDKKQAALLDALLVGIDDPFQCLETYRSVFLTKQGAPKAFARSFVTQDVSKQFPDLEAIFSAECARLEDVRETQAKIVTVRSTTALLTYAHAILHHYASLKRLQGSLDYGDLIAATRHLLAEVSEAEWVRFKLDGGIDHVLVDEAQDTSPDMWRIVRELTGDFFAGETARARNRTVFAVGDDKQSIYSFQGADPAEFARQRGRFRHEAERASTRFEPVTLQLSFRSTADVLAAVDLVFQEMPADDLVSEGDYPVHSAFRHRDQGHVELWPMEIRNESEEPKDWMAPVDALLETSPEAKLAQRLADKIKSLISSETISIDSVAKPITAGDILVLVRKRGPFVESLSRALKMEGVPVAGADRLALAEHIAVKDLLALTEVALLPQSDLALASVLRGPLFQLSEQELFEIAHARGAKSLRQALREAAPQSERLSQIEERLSQWIGRADRAPPFEFYVRLIGPDGGRTAFLSRLGVEADDILDEFLALALTYERSAVTPTLQGFLAHFAEAAGEIKREPEASRNEVRMMTVHGAKGLEAPVVFLVDPGSEPVASSHLPKLVRHARPNQVPALLWVQSKKSGFATSEQSVALEQEKRVREKEYRRLLYVGMTRARDRLYVCGYAGKNGPSQGCWHNLVDRALRPTATPIVVHGTERALVWRKEPLNDQQALTTDLRSTDVATTSQFVRPDWVDRPPPPPAEPLAITPSGDLGPEPESDGEATSPTSAQPPITDQNLIEAARRGTYIHALFQHLAGRAVDERRAIIRRIDDAHSDVPDHVREEGVRNVLAILDDEAFAALFGEQGRAEVALSGDLKRTDDRLVRVSGRIDQLVFTENRLLIVDYKTSGVVPHTEAQIPDVYVRQLALYRLLLQTRFPDVDVSAGLLWTAGPKLQLLSHERMDTLTRDFVSV